MPAMTTLRDAILIGLICYLAGIFTAAAVPALLCYYALRWAKRYAGKLPPGWRPPQPPGSDEVH